MTTSEENLQVLLLVQAMVGAITPNLRRVALEMLGPGAVRLSFVLEQEDAEDREEIDDVVFEFEALQPRGIEVEVNVSVDTRPIEQIELPARIVYGRKE